MREARAAQRKKTETRGRDGRRGKAPPPPATTLFIPLSKSTVTNIFGLWLNLTREYIGVYLFFELFIYSENWVAVS